MSSVLVEIKTLFFPVAGRIVGMFLIFRGKYAPLTIKKVLFPYEKYVFSSSIAMPLGSSYL